MAVLRLLGSGQHQHQPHNTAVTVGLDGTIRRWSLHPAEMEDARRKKAMRAEPGDEDEGEAEGEGEEKARLMTEDEERELAELMD